MLSMWTCIHIPSTTSWHYLFSKTSRDCTANASCNELSCNQACWLCAVGINANNDAGSSSRLSLPAKCAITGCTSAGFCSVAFAAGLARAGMGEGNLVSHLEG